MEPTVPLNDATLNGLKKSFFLKLHGFLSSRSVIASGAFKSFRGVGYCLLSEVINDCLFVITHKVIEGLYKVIEGSIPRQEVMLSAPNYVSLMPNYRENIILIKLHSL